MDNFGALRLRKGRNTNLRIGATILSFFLCCASLHAQQVEIVVTNPSSAARTNEPVVIPWSSVHGKFDTAAPSLSLTDDGGKAIPVQIDDLNFDGKEDELTFVANFDPEQMRKFTLLPDVRSKEFPARTEARNYKRVDGVLRSIDDDDVPGTGRERKAYRFDGVGWESEVVGYRLYLDERNATDIQGKRIPGLYWNWIGESGVDYQLDAFWGMDVLHVGPALGIGGIGFWIGDSVKKPLVLDRQRCRIVARGPVRAVVRNSYFGWDLGGEKVDVTSQFSIYAGDRISEHKVILDRSSSARTLVTGIVKHDSTKIVWNAKQGYLFTLGHQSRANDTLFMALVVDPSKVKRKSSDQYNELLLLNIERGKPISILLTSYWQGETGRMWSQAEIEEFLESTVRRMAEPMVIEIH